MREAWPSPATGTALGRNASCAAGPRGDRGDPDQLVLFGDGVESDTVPLTWGQTARLRISSRSLRLLH